MSTKDKDLSSNEVQSTNKINVIENVLTNLKIISSLKPSDKITKQDGLLVIDQADTLVSFRRWWYAESRSSGISSIEELINASFTIIDNIYNNELDNSDSSSDKDNYYHKRLEKEEYFKTENSTQLLIFSTELTNSIKGLQNLKITYKDDISICSKIDVIIEKTNIRIAKIGKLLKIQTIHHVKDTDS